MLQLISKPITVGSKFPVNWTIFKTKILGKRSGRYNKILFIIMDTKTSQQMKKEYMEAFKQKFFQGFSGFHSQMTGIGKLSAEEL